MKSFLFVEYPKCTTCQKAKKWLDDNRIAYTDRHIVELNPTEQELGEWISRSGLPIRKFFNTNGLLYKDMGLKDKLPAMTVSDQIKLLATNGMLVKRPLVVGPHGILVGFKPDEWKKALL